MDIIYLLLHYPRWLSFVLCFSSTNIYSFGTSCLNHYLSGKTNHGSILYGRATRHKDPLQCSVGALSFYLGIRFHLSNEFNTFTISDWTNNQKWFDIKLLVGDIGRANTLSDLCKAINNHSYAKAVKTVLKMLNIASNHWVHLGRGLGSKILELTETDREEIRVLGNWDPKMQDTVYSGKMPMPAIRNIAGYVIANGMYFNPRTMVNVSDELIQLTPFAFVLKALPAMEIYLNTEGSRPTYTAYNFLLTMKELAQVFVQDAAAMAVLHPNRVEGHPLFDHLHMFHSGLFIVSNFSVACIDY